MAKPLQHRPQSLGEFNIPTGHSTVFQQKAKNIKALGEFGQALTDPIAESIIGEEARADRLAKFELEKNLPIEELPQSEEEGINLWGLTKWGIIRDKSYNELDKQIIEYQANTALENITAELSNPATQGPGMTQRYEEKAAQILKAYTGLATPANKTDISLKLMNNAQNYRFQIAQKEQQITHQRTRASLEALWKQDVTRLNDELLANKHDEAFLTKHKADQLITAQVNNNILTPEEGMAKREELNRLYKETSVIGEGLSHIEQGTGPKYLADFVRNPPSDFSVTEVYETAVKLNQYQNAYDAALSKYETSEKVRLENDIANGLVTEPWQAINYDLSGPDYLEAETTIIKSLGQRNSAMNQLRDFENAVKNNSTSTLPKSLVSKVYESTQESNAQLAQENGTNLTPAMMSQSILGVGNVYPVSGTRGKSLGTNVPEFDNQIGAMLTSNDPTQMVEAAKIFIAHTKLANQPNTLSLSNEEVLIATNLNAAIRANADPIQAAINVSKALDKTNPINQYRAAEFDGEQFKKKLPRYFKDVMGTSSNDVENDAAFANFKTLFRQNYIIGGSLEGALDATRYQMKEWGESDYFPDGKVLQNPPERTNIFKAGFSFDNQMMYRLQQALNLNDDYKWADETQTLNLHELTDAQKVLFPLNNITIENKESMLRQWSDNPETIADVDISKSALPRIKVKDANGEWDSDVYLWSDNSVNYTNNGNPRYQMLYKDRFGNPQNIVDGNGNIVYFNPVNLNEWAPEMAKGENLKEIKRIAKEIHYAPAKEVLFEAIKSTGTQGIFGTLLNPALRKNVKKAGQIMEENPLEAIERNLTGEENAQ